MSVPEFTQFDPDELPEDDLTGDDVPWWQTELAAHAETLDQLSGLVLGFTGQITSTTTGLDALSELVTALHTQLQHLRKMIKGESSARAAATWCWPDLDADAAEQRWGQLTRWVRWLVAEYEFSTPLPSCWPRHRAAVYELDALRLAWQHAYTVPADPDDAATPSTSAGSSAVPAQDTGAPVENSGQSKASGSDEDSGADAGSRDEVWIIEAELGPADWHDRLHRVWGRLVGASDALLKGCAERHLARLTFGDEKREQLLATALQETVYDDLQRRRDQTQPHPWRHPQRPPTPEPRPTIAPTVSVRQLP